MLCCVLRHHFLLHLANPRPTPNSAPPNHQNAPCPPRHLLSSSFLLHPSLPPSRNKKGANRRPRPAVPPLKSSHINLSGARKVVKDRRHPRHRERAEPLAAAQQRRFCGEGIWQGQSFSRKIVAGTRLVRTNGGVARQQEDPHRDRVSFDSEEGKGSVFRIELARDRVRELLPAPASGEPGTGNET